MRSHIQLGSLYFLSVIDYYDCILMPAGVETLISFSLLSCELQSIEIPVLRVFYLIFTYVYR